MSVPNALIAGEGGDPRDHVPEHERDIQLTSNDVIDINLNNQPLEVYEYYAAIERAREDADTTPDPPSPWVGLYRRLTGKQTQETQAVTAPATISEKQEKSSESDENPKEASKNSLVITESERYHAYRALRTATWHGVFFLITTDILGPFSAPFAFQQLGYAGGVLCYTILGFLAILGGQVLWRLYMRLDSSRYPCKIYADIGERLFGRFIRHVFNILQGLQLLLNVGLITLGSAQTLAAIIEYKFCFSILNVFWMIVGMILGQIKTLRKFAWLANLAVWLNVIVMLLTIIGTAKFGPTPTLNFPDATSVDKIITTALAPAGNNWYLQMVGMQQAVFSYGGAMIFVEFMAEMRRPRDFWKGAILAQFFIYIVYMFYGMIVYAFAGQYSYIISPLIPNNQVLIDVSNIIGLASGMIAAALYGNIGIKVLYINILQPYFGAPDVGSTRGRATWIITVVAYWAFAFVISSAIPNLSAMSTLVGAFCILQFTYTFPPILYLGYLMQKDANEGDKKWEPGMEPYSNRIDTWKDFSRWRRAVRKQFFFKVLLFLLFLGACAFWGLGSYAGIKSIQVQFAASGSSVSFSCRAPGQPRDVPTPP